MKTPLILTLLCTAPLLQSCESTPPKQAWTMKPVMQVRHSNESPSAYYQLGRYYQGQNRLDKAVSAFRKALELDSQYAEAHNALGALYATQGKFDLAIAEFQAALVSSPNTAHFHNNLGYAYYLQGRYAEAAPVFDKAAALNPGDARISNNLGLTLAKLGQPRQAREAFMLAAARSAEASAPTPGPDTTGETATARTAPLSLPKDQGVIAPAISTPLARAPLPTAKPLAAPAEAPRTAPKPDMTLVQSSPNRYELRHNVDEPATVLALQEAISAPRLRLKARFEVANGNGVTGMAKRVGRVLADKGFPSARLTNQKPFRQPVTLVEYRKGFASEAERLSASLPAKPMIKERNSLRSSTDIRLVLGKDVAYNVALVTPEQESLRLALNVASKPQN
ncbi:LytR C-terminal domain-containing protein [Pseudogulbenkiania sp. MAI-1]|uniref:LytR C-terminal domain-containing protein n=1 Tax=Pseudogulbenkiania sp. MAI-1 TaxID=990370 RepID=UPI0004A2B1C4|nr:LytR C-terminal domain-containing protein [Pseudogulbenkiania sp. MAI-1]